jgi:monovalent cation:H+ antiporter-2, CPA2 family
MGAEGLSHYNATDFFIILITASVIVPIINRFKVSPILAFLLAGIVLGPHGLGTLGTTFDWIKWVTITGQKEVERISELGIVFLLFLIGLDISIARLINLRRMVLGLGASQFFLCSLAIGAVVFFVTGSLSVALITGACLALSSTAIVLEHLKQQQRLTSNTGRATFVTLLFQDLMVVPILFLISVLGQTTDHESIGYGLALAMGQAFLSIAAIVLIGRRILKPLFHNVAQHSTPDVFMAATLLVALGTGAATAAFGLSMALGAFIAGLLLAETEYSKSIEATLEPFKGLLLGVFFLSIGMRLNLEHVMQNALWIAAALFALITLKTLLTLPLGRLNGLSPQASLNTALLLASGGEFTFVIVSLANNNGLLTQEASNFILAITSLSMMVITGLDRLALHVNNRWRPNPDAEEHAQLAPEHDHHEAPAIIIGYGRVGQIVGRLLDRQNIPYIALEANPNIASQERKKGVNIYFGDTLNEQFMRSCGVHKAKTIIITPNTQTAVDEMIIMVRRLNPDGAIVARARDANHAKHLYTLGATDAVPETIEASLQLSETTLVSLGVPMGHVISSIHEERSQYRKALQDAATNKSMKKTESSK